jgi:enoyl-CoA hydratase/carnithine racemase
LPDLLSSVSDGVLTLTFDRPSVLNAFSDSMSSDFAAAVEGVASRPEVRAVVVTGAGDAFSAGADISGSDAHLRFDVRALDRANRMVRAVISCPVPVVAAVNGVAAGVGCSIALASDLVVASSSASFLLAFTRIGLMPDGGASFLVAASVGRARALRMALLAEPLSASSAFDVGLVSHLVEPSSFDATVSSVAARLAAGPPVAFAATKKAINAATLAGLDDALERERTSQTVLLRTADAAEGMRAFNERRRPVFRGE